MNESERLRQLVMSQRRLSLCGDDVAAALRALAEESFALTGGDGAIVEIANRDEMTVRSATGTLADLQRIASPRGRGFFVNRFPLHEAICFNHRATSPYGRFDCQWCFNAFDEDTPLCDAGRKPPVLRHYGRLGSRVRRGGTRSRVRND